MTLAPDAKKLIQLAVKEAVAEALENHCQFDEEAIKTIKHVTWVFSDIGGGDPNKGVENFREHTKFVRAFIGTRNRIGNIVLAVFLTSIIGGTLAALAKVVWDAIKK